MTVEVTASFKIDTAAIASLCDPGQPVGRATERAAATTAERARSAVDARGLVDTGRMRSSIGFTVDYGQDQVTARVSADVPYAIYHHGFLIDALNQLTPSDFGGAS